MKRSFYEMLGVPHDADQAMIDAAYESVTSKMNATTNLRGAAEAVTEMNLIRDGYQILSDAVKRARYDAKLAAAESGVQLIFFPAEQSARRKLGVETVIFAALTAVFGGIVYWQLTHKMDEVRVEHTQSLAKQRNEQNRPPTLDVTQPEAPVANAGGGKSKVR